MRARLHHIACGHRRDGPIRRRAERKLHPQIAAYGLGARGLQAVQDGLCGGADLRVLNPGPIARNSHRHQDAEHGDGDRELDHREAGLLVFHD